MRWQVGIRAATSCLFLMLALSAVGAAEPSSDEQQVRNVLQAYIDATRTADAKLARGLFHANALMSGELDENARIGSPEPFFKSLESASGRPGDTGYQAWITAVSVLGRTASGEIVEQNLFGYDFTNRFHLLEQDGRWLIVSKLYCSATAKAR